MPCYAVIRALLGLESFEAVEQGAREIGWRVVRLPDSRVELHSPEGRILTFRKEGNRVVSEEARKADIDELKMGQLAKKTKENLFRKGYQVYQQRRVDDKIELTFRG